MKNAKIRNKKQEKKQEISKRKIMTPVKNQDIKDLYELFNKMSETEFNSWVLQNTIASNNKIWKILSEYNHIADGWLMTELVLTKDSEEPAKVSLVKRENWDCVEVNNC